MTLNRRIGLGFTLAVDTSGGTSFTTLGAIVDGFDEADAKASTGDISILADTYMLFSKSQIDPGEMTLEIAYDPDDTSTTTLITALKSIIATAPNWQINFPAGTQGAGSTTSETFLGHLVGFGRTVKKDKLVAAKITIKKTGNPGFHGA